MKRTILGVICIFLSLSFCGCALVLVGGGVAGGLAMGKDKATLTVDKSYSTAWDVTRTTIADRGIITLEDEKHGKIEAKVDKSDVKAHIKQVTKKTVQIEVKARKTKGMFPNMDLTTELINKINEKLS